MIINILNITILIMGKKHTLMVSHESVLKLKQSSKTYKSSLI